MSSPDDQPGVAQGMRPRPVTEDLAAGSGDDWLLHRERSGLRRVWWAFIYSMAGLRSAYSTSSAFRQETWLAAALLPAAFWVGRDWTQTAVLCSTVALVLVVELLNSAIEATVDRISLDHHRLSKCAKDMGSAAVLVALVLCAAVWTIALVSRLA